MLLPKYVMTLSISEDGTAIPEVGPTKPLEPSPTIGTIPRGDIKAILGDLRYRVSSTCNSNANNINEELTPLDTKFTIVSPSTPDTDTTDEGYRMGIKQAAIDFNDLLANHTGRDEVTDKPFISPEEIKSADAFEAEILEKGQDRVLILLRNKEGKVIDGVYGPIYVALNARGKETLYATLEYQGSEASNHGLGFGSTAFELYLAKLREIARERNIGFGGIVIEAVSTAEAYWEYVGARSPYFIAGDNAIKIDYAMPQLDFDPETGEPTSTDILRENIKLIPAVYGKSTVTVGQWKNIITAFYETSYIPARQRFNSDAAWETAKASVTKTLQDICLAQFDEVPDDTVLYLKFDKELQPQKGLETIKPWLLEDKK